MKKKISSNEAASKTGEKKKLGIVKKIVLSGSLTPVDVDERVFGSCAQNLHRK